MKEKQKYRKEIKKYRMIIGNTTTSLITNDINKYEWVFFMKPAEGETSLSRYAEYVEIDLDKSFPTHHIVISSIEPIKIRRRGWGTFKISIKIFWRK